MGSTSARILMLDIDDVLVSNRAYAMGENLRRLQMRKQRVAAPIEQLVMVAMDPAGVMLINRIAEVADARIVVCSTWRWAFGVDRTLNALAEAGLRREYLHDSPVCPVVTESRPDKAEDIRAWIDQHGAEVEKIVILDDDGRLGAVERTHSRVKLVRVDGEDGLLLKHVRRVLQAFGRPDPLMPRGV